jgi:hypothetical protein
MNKNPRVDAYMQALENPLKDLWEQIRESVLAVDPAMEEDIKWGAPTFIYKGNLATFNPRAKKFVNLTFHTGALIPDPEGVLDGDAKEARVFRIETSAELSQKKMGLEKVVKNWIQLRDR